MFPNAGRPPKRASRQPDGRAESAPAAIDAEDGLTATVHPHASPVPAPGLSFDATRLGNLALDANIAAATGIDLAHVVLVVAAGALHADRLVPVGTRSP